jgi:hypothetical protein
MGSEEFERRTGIARERRLAELPRLIAEERERMEKSFAEEERKYLDQMSQIEKTMRERQPGERFSFVEPSRPARYYFGIQMLEKEQARLLLERNAHEAEYRKLLDEKRTERFNLMLGLAVLAVIGAAITFFFFVR